MAGRGNSLRDSLRFKTTTCRGGSAVRPTRDASEMVNMKLLSRYVFLAEVRPNQGNEDTK